MGPHPCALLPCLLPPLTFSSPCSCSSLKQPPPPSDQPLPPSPPPGVIFFSLVLFSGPLEPSLAAMGLTPLYAAVLVGAAQNIFSKSSK